MKQKLFVAGGIPVVSDLFLKEGEVYLVTPPNECQFMPRVPMASRCVEDRSDALVFRLYSKIVLPPQPFSVGADFAMDSPASRQMWLAMFGPLVGQKRRNRLQRKLDRRSNVRRRKRKAELKIRRSK